MEVDARPSAKTIVGPNMYQSVVEQNLDDDEQKRNIINLYKDSDIYARQRKCGLRLFDSFEFDRPQQDHELGDFDRKITKRAGQVCIRLGSSESVFEAVTLHSELISAIGEATVRKIVLDASGLAEIDATFSQLLIALGRWAKDAEKEFEIKGLPEDLRTRFETAGIAISC